MPKAKGKSQHVSLIEGFVSRLRPKTATEVIDYYSTAIPNFSLRMRPPSQAHQSGLLTWRFGPRFEGKPIYLMLGHYPAMPSKEAHSRALEAWRLVDLGQDPRPVLCPSPSVPAPAVKPVYTIADGFKRYDPELDGKSRNHQNAVRGYFTNHILPAWGPRGVDTFELEEIADFLHALGNDHGKIMANRCASTLTAFGNYLRSQGKVKTNPFADLPKTKEETRARYLEPNELALVWRASQGLGAAGRFIRLLIALPMRRNEAAELPRSEVNEGIWLLPQARNKSSRDFMVPLSSLARDILADCPDTGRFYFSTTGKNPIGGFTRIKQNLDAAILKLQGPGEPALAHWTLHDLRRSIRTGLSSLKVDRVVSEKLLNHAPSKLEGTYDRFAYLDEKREALQRWADHFSEELTKTELPMAAE